MAENNGNGEIIKVKMATLRTLVMFFSLGGTIIAGSWAFLDVKRTGEQTLLMLEKHIADSDRYLDRTLFEVTSQSLGKQVDDLSKEIKSINSKLDQYIMRNK